MEKQTNLDNAVMVVGSAVTGSTIIQARNDLPIINNLELKNMLRSMHDETPATSKGVLVVSDVHIVDRDKLRNIALKESVLSCLRYSSCELTATDAREYLDPIKTHHAGKGDPCGLRQQFNRRGKKW